MNIAVQSQKNLFWFLLISVLIYLLLSLSWTLQSSQQAQQFRQLQLDVKLLQAAQHVTQQLQSERGMLAGYLTGELPVRPTIELQQLLTDAVLRDFDLLQQQHGDTELRQSIVALKQALAVIRHQAQQRQIGSDPLKLAYTELIRPLLALSDQLQLNHEIPVMQTLLQANKLLTEAIEHAGLERATLHMAFARQTMSPSRFQSYVILVNNQKNYLQQLAGMLQAGQQQFWRQIDAQTENGAFTSMREQALQQDFTADPTLWFSLASRRIDLLYQFQFHLNQQLLLTSRQLLLNELQQAEFLHQQNQWLLLITMLLMWRLYRLHHYPPALQLLSRHSAQH